MKRTALIPVSVTTILLAGLVWFNFGCGKNATPASTPAKPGAGDKYVSVEKTSFNDVTSQLDPGGNFYLYLGTAQWLQHLSSKVENWRDAFAAMPGITAADTADLNKAFGAIGQVIKDSGVEDVTGVGMSSVEIEKGMYRNKMLLHHYAGSGNGFLWKLCGGKPHALDGLDLLPTNTALAVFSDADLPLLWNVVQQEAKQSGFPNAPKFLEQLPDQFEKATNVKWDDFVKSLGGEIGFALTLNESNTIPVPVPNAAVQIPEPGLMLVLKVNDETIFNRIDQELKKDPQVISINKTGLKMRTRPVPVPFLGTLRPTAASSGGYLFIASSDDLVQEALQVKAGKLPGLKDTAEFKHLSRDIPKQGNQFSFMSERFGRMIFQVQQQVLQAQVAREQHNAQTQWMQSLLGNRTVFGYSVGANTAEGCLTVGNSSESLAKTVLVPLAVIPAMLPAIAIPNFVKARETAQRNQCINNLRQIDAAKAQWALEKSKSSSDVPTKADLMPFLHRWPVCPKGGHYTIGPVSEPPTCSVPGHVLP